MTKQRIQQLKDQYGDCPQTMSGFDDCIVGVAIRSDGLAVLCYDREKVIGKLIGSDLDRAEAEAFFEFNQLGAYVGPRTPCFLITE